MTQAIEAPRAALHSLVSPGEFGRDLETSIKDRPEYRPAFPQDTIGRRELLFRFVRQAGWFRKDRIFLVFLDLLIEVSPRIAVIRAADADARHDRDRVLDGDPAVFFAALFDAFKCVATAWLWDSKCTKNRTTENSRLRNK